MQSPSTRIDLHWLSCQRQMLGVDAFRTIVAEHLDTESMTHLLSLLDAFDRAQEAEKERSSPAADAPEPMVGESHAGVVA